MADGLFFSQIPFYHKSIMEQENTQAFAPFHLKEPGSAITHFIGMVLANMTLSFPISSVATTWLIEY